MILILKKILSLKMKKIFFKDNNSQINLLEKSICEFIKLIKEKNKSSIL